MIRDAYAALGAVMIATTACSVRGTEIAPVAPMPPTAFERAADVAFTTTEPVDGWWTTFQDARLASLVSRRSIEARTSVKRRRSCASRARECESRKAQNWPVA